MIAGSEVEIFKKTIADKDREIAELSGELQTLEAQLQEVCKYSKEEEEKVHRLTVETSELRAKLVEAERQKQEVEKQLEAAYHQMELLQHLIAELKERKKKCAASQVDCCVHCVETQNLCFLM